MAELSFGLELVHAIEAAAREFGLTEEQLEALFLGLEQGLVDADAARAEAARASAGAALERIVRAHRPRASSARTNPNPGRNEP